MVNGRIVNVDCLSEAWRSRSHSSLGVETIIKSTKTFILVHSSEDWESARPETHRAPVFDNVASSANISYPTYVGKIGDPSDWHLSSQVGVAFFLEPYLSANMRSRSSPRAPVPDATYLSEAKGDPHENKVCCTCDCADNSCLGEDLDREVTATKKSASVSSQQNNCLRPPASHRGRKRRHCYKSFSHY